jgi:hypothetical protein
MQEWSTPLVLATAAFLAVLLWRVRPLVPGRRLGASREAILEAHARIENAPNERERARALCDAADLMNPGSAKGLYLRAIRTDPSSLEVIDRAVGALARQPRALEGLLWRYLALSSWRDNRDATAVALDALRALYEGRLRNATRARAMANAREALLGVLPPVVLPHPESQEEPPPRAPPQLAPPR